MSDILVDAWYNLAKVTTDAQMRAVYLRNANEHAPELVGTYVTERVIEYLPTLIDHRNYHLLEEHLEWLIQTQGWKETLMTLRECAKIPPEMDEMAKFVFRQHAIGLPGMDGKTRDALFHVLGLAPLVGLDFNPLKELIRVKGESLSVIREKALNLTMKRMKMQIEKQNTFFLDTEKLKETPFNGLVQTIIDARETEIHNLIAEPTLRDVFSTYHGFDTFVRYSTHEWGNTVTEGRTAFKRLVKSLGKSITWKGKGKILPIRNTIWTNVSPEMHRLLLSLLKVSLGREAERAAIELTYSGESRVVNLLRHMYNRGRLGRALRSDVANAMREIGEVCERDHNNDFWIMTAKNMSDRGHGG